MSNKLRIKIAIDVTMTILIISLMAYSKTGQLFHEIVGTFSFMLFLIHNFLNGNWYKNIFKGRYTAIRILQTVINLLTTILMVLLMISGIIMSGYIFAFIPIEGGMAWARNVHLIAAYWGFVLISLHLGVHWNMVTGILNKKICGICSKGLSCCLRIAGIIVAVYGAYIFIKYKLFDYMFLNTMFASVYENSMVMFFVDYIAIMGLFVFIAYYLSKILRMK